MRFRYDCKTSKDTPLLFKPVALAFLGVTD